MARWKPFILGLLVAGALGSALAAGDRAVSLDDAVTRALASHPAVLRAQKEVDAARGRRLQLEAVPNPELSFEAVGLPLWNSKGDREFSLGVRQRLEFPGKRGLRREIGRSGEDQAALELERVRNVVRGRTERAYFRAAYALNRVADLESILATLKEYSELAAERYKNGQVPYLDVIRGRLESLRVRNEIVEARRELKERTMALGLLMGDERYEPLEFTTGIDFSPLGRSFEELKAAALAGSTLRLTAAREIQAGLSLSLARKSGLPDFIVGLFTPSKKLGEWGVEVGLTLPLFRKEYRGAAIEAEAVSEQAAIEARGQARRVLLVLERSYTDVQALEEQIGLFHDSLLRDVEESLKAGLISYQYGKTDALGVLDIVRSLKESRAEFLRALLNHRLALIEIAAAGEDEDLGVGNTE
jgi:cobalt-zinc-cadmium efflux system outer membrane protein